MDRRKALKLLGSSALPFSALGAHGAANLPKGNKGKHYDVVVVGAGVFGTWCAAKLHERGKKVAVIDAYSPAHSAASSGGESRVTRVGYGDAQLYSEWAHRSLFEWRALSKRASLPLLYESGVLWLHKQDDNYVRESTRVLNKLNLSFENFNAKELRRRYPSMSVADDEYGFYELQGGALMARRAVQTLAAELAEQGVDFIQGRVKEISSEQGEQGRLPQIKTDEQQSLYADQYVFACGPWLNKVCPQAMQDRLFVTRQEILYFASDVSITDMPVWADLPFYGVPNIEGRGFKVADDQHGERIDPDTESRVISQAAQTKAREFLATRFPSIAEQPILESRVCQYENSSNGDLLIDYHPGLDNVLLVGCGSGHGFKHGPALGSHVADVLATPSSKIARFSLDSKTKDQNRSIQ